MIHVLMIAATCMGMMGLWFVIDGLNLLYGPDDSQSLAPPPIRKPFAERIDKEAT